MGQVLKQKKNISSSRGRLLQEDATAAAALAVIFEYEGSPENFKARFRFSERSWDLRSLFRSATTRHQHLHPKSVYIISPVHTVNHSEEGFFLYSVIARYRGCGNTHPWPY
ncbi:hypothetical protein C1H46_019076 [Malus baccata]|uniref:Uncharacterized protein n=1 Tax=Malus baccata TaxID=106549 RepID=A0A540M959_MALBA|nr:hypothetical protein C1H46_019076 [Malus baccata]